MKKWLLKLAPTYKEFMFEETIELLKMFKIDHQIEMLNKSFPLMILNCTTNTIDFLLERSIFIKNASSFEIPLKDCEKTAKLKIYYYIEHKKKEEKELFKQKKLYLIQGFQERYINPEYIVEIHVADQEYNTLFYRESKRRIFLKYDIKFRPFIGITAMDWEISIMLANICRMDSQTFACDPFAGSCSILLACSLFNAKLFAIEYDKKMLIGHKTIHQNCRTALLGSNVFDNFTFMDKLNTLVAIIREDMRMVVLNVKLDVVITDPPYGNIISLNKHEITAYIQFLKSFCDINLKNGGVLCFFTNIIERSQILSIFVGYHNDVFIEQYGLTYKRYLYRFTKHNQ